MHKYYKNLCLVVKKALEFVLRDEVDGIKERLTLNALLSQEDNYLWNLFYYVANDSEGRKISVDIMQNNKIL